MERISRLLAHLGPAEQTQVMFPLAPPLPCTLCKCQGFIAFAGPLQM